MTPSQPRGARGLTNSQHLDLVRGIAAIAVLYSHAYYLLFSTATSGSRGQLLAQISRLFARFGHTSVIVFFVLSGFFVGGIVVREVGARSWSWKKYATARLVRLYIVLIPGLFLTAGWDQLSGRLTSGVPPTSETARAIITSALISRRHGIGTFLGNVGFLQTVLVPPYGSDTPLWSLCNEFWYYLAFPCFWVALRSSAGPIRRLCHALAGAAILILVGKSISLYFLIWLMGTAVCLIPRLPRACRSLITSIGVAALLPLLVALSLIGLGRVAPERVDFIVGVGFAAGLYAMLHRTVPSRAGLYAAVAGTLAGFSYSLYVAHLPVLIFFRAWLTYRRPWVPDGRHLLYAAGIVVLVIGYAWLIAMLTEAHTDSVRRWVQRLAGPRKPVVPVPQLAGQSGG